MDGAPDSLLVLYLLYFPLILGVFEVRHLHELSIIVTGTIFLKQLHKKNRVQSGVLSWQAEPVHLAPKPFQHPSRAKQRRDQLGSLRTTGIRSDSDQVSHMDWLVQCTV